MTSAHQLHPRHRLLQADDPGPVEAPSETRDRSELRRVGGGGHRGGTGMSSPAGPSWRRRRSISHAPRRRQATVCPEVRPQLIVGVIRSEVDSKLPVGAGRSRLPGGKYAC